MVEPAYRKVGLGSRVTRELLDIAEKLGLRLAMMELVAEWVQGLRLPARSHGPNLV